MEEVPRVLFREEQSFRQWWIWVPLVVPAVISIGLFVGLLIDLLGLRGTDVPLRGDLLWGRLIPIVTMVLLTGLLWRTRLVTEVRPDGIYVQYIPFHWKPRHIPAEAIRACAPRTYRPILEYGGWGLRFGASGNAYNVSGNRGVQLEIEGRRPLLIGSQRPEELAAAIRSIAPNLQDSDAS